MDSLISAPWRKSSYSGNDNSTECVEVATWRKATYSGNSGTECVVAGVAPHGDVLIRDTTNRDGTVLAVPAEAWSRFTASLT
jgi:Domain of unknown function (DUF397)